jgi:hypothetical protein
MEEDGLVSEWTGVQPRKVLKWKVRKRRGVRQSVSLQELLKSKPDK